MKIFFKSVFPICTLLAASSGLFGQTTSSGDWNDPAIWTGGAIPGPNSTGVQVRHDVSLSGNISISAGTYYFGWNGTSATNSLVTDVAGGAAYSLTLSKTGGYSASQCILDIRSGITTFEGPATLDNANLIVRSCATLIVGPLSISNNTRIVIEQGATLIVNGNVVDTNNGGGALVVQGYVKIYGSYSATTGSVEITGTGSFETTGAIVTNGNSSVFGSTNDCTTGPCSGASLGCGSGGVSYTNAVSPASQSVCSGQAPQTLAVNTNAPVTTYQWQMSTTSAGSGFSAIAGANSSSLDPAVITQNTWYRVVISTASCTSTSPAASAEVIVSALPTVADAGIDQNICFGASTTLQGNTPTAGNGSWTLISGPDNNPAQFSNAGDPQTTFTPAAAGAFALRWTIANGCATSSSDVTIEAVASSVLTWTGSAADQQWSNPQNWSCPQIPAGSQDVVIPDGATVIVDNHGAAKTISIAPAATLTVLAGQQLFVNGDFTNNGTFTCGSGATLSVAGNLTSNGGFTVAGATVVLNGTASQTIHTSNAEYDVLAVNKSAGTVTLTSPLRIAGELDLQSNTVFQSNGNLIILSRGMTTDLDGRIAPILNGGTITGNVQVQRYMDAIGSVFRYVASPVKNASKPAALPNLYRYSASRWVKHTGLMNNGEGFATQTSNSQITWNVSGEVHTGDRTWNFPTEGWYLIGNPYAAAVHWNNNPEAWAIDATRVSTTIAVTDNSVNGYPNYFRYYQYDSTNPVNWGEGPMVNGVIAMGQSFWVYSLAGGSLTIRESAKAVEHGEFYRDQDSDGADQLFIRMDDGQFADQALLRISKGATEGFELKYDLPKLWNPEMNVYFLDRNETEMLRHAISDVPADAQIRLGFTVTREGNYGFSFSNADQFSFGQTMYLVDRYEGISVPVVSGDRYSFTVTHASEVNDRFYLTLRPEEMVKAERPLLAWPNPVRDNLTLRSPDDLHASAELYDQQGRSVFSHSWIGQSEVDMTSLRPGLYIMKVKTSKGMEMLKIVRE